jgi:hypothetical protein
MILPASVAFRWLFLIPDESRLLQQSCAGLPSSRQVEKALAADPNQQQ